MHLERIVTLMFINKMIERTTTDKNMDLLIDEICNTLEKNNITYRYLVVTSGPIVRGPDDCSPNLIIVTEDEQSLYFNYERHGFTPHRTHIYLLAN